MKYKVSDLAKTLGVTTNTIRRYEDNGYITPERDSSDYRWYQSSDIHKTAVIRLLIKCGFTHSEIKGLMHSSSDKICNTYTDKLAEIDEELNRLYFLRHWLKDNLQLIKTIEEMGQNYIIRDSRALKYITYSKGDKLLNEKARLKTINDFMYNIPEVQLINIFKLEDIEKGLFIPLSAWAMKSNDVKRLNVEDIINNNEFVETYSAAECLYAVFEIPAKYVNDTDKLTEIRKEFFDKINIYMQQNSMQMTGDVVEFLVNVLGDTASSLVCIPIE